MCSRASRPMCAWLPSQWRTPASTKDNVICLSNHRGQVCRKGREIALRITISTPRFGRCADRNRARWTLDSKRVPFVNLSKKSVNCFVSVWIEFWICVISKEKMVHHYPKRYVARVIPAWWTVIFFEWDLNTKRLGRLSTSGSVGCECIGRYWLSLFTPSKTIDFHSATEIKFLWFHSALTEREQSLAAKYWNVAFHEQLNNNQQ